MTNIFNNIIDDLLYCEIIRRLSIKSIINIGSTSKSLNNKMNDFIKNNIDVVNYLSYDYKNDYINTIKKSHLYINYRFDKLLNTEKYDYDRDKIKNTYNLLYYYGINYNIDNISDIIYNYFFSINIKANPFKKSELKLKNHKKKCDNISCMMINILSGLDIKKNIYNIGYDLFDIYQIIHNISFCKYKKTLEILKNIKFENEITIKKFNSSLATLLSYCEKPITIDIKAVLCAVIYIFIEKNINHINENYIYYKVFINIAIEKGKMYLESLNNDNPLICFNIAKYLRLFIIKKINNCCKKLLLCG